MANFTNLNLDRTKIQSCLSNLDIITVIINETDTKIEYKITKNEKTCKIVIFYKRNGTTSLQIQGKDSDLGNEICTEIKSITQFYTIDTINASIKISKEDFETILTRVEKTYPENLTKRKIAGGTSYTLEKTKEGRFTFNYYNSTKLLLQGKTLSFFTFIINSLTELNYDALSHVLRATQTIQLEESDELIKEYLPKLGSKLPSQIINVMTSSLQLIRLNANFSDYSIMLFPALKTLEHVIIVVLENNGYTYDRYAGFNMFKKWSPNNSYYLPKSGQIVINESTRIKIGNCYSFFNKQRHGLFHLGSDLTDIRIIEQKEQALDLLMECIDLMEDISDDVHT